MLLSKEWLCGGAEVLTGWCQRSSLHHTEGHYSAIWHHQCAGQYQCQGTLPAGSSPHRTGTWSPFVSSSGTYSYLWGTTSRFPRSTSLPVQLQHPCCGSTHKSCGWTGCSCQPSTSGGPPHQDCWRDKQPSIKRMGLGGSRPPKSHCSDLNQGQKQARELLLQMGAPVCVQWPRSRQYCSDQA